MTIQLIQALSIISILFLSSLLTNLVLIRAWYTLDKNHNNLLKDAAEIKKRSQMSFQAKIGSKASIFTTLLYQNTPLRVEIPAILKEKSHDSSQYRFGIDWSAVPNGIPFVDVNFIVAMKYQMNAWYHAGSNLITWLSLEEKPLTLSEEEKKDVGLLLDYSAQLSEEKKKSIKQMLSI